MSAGIEVQTAYAARMIAGGSIGVVLLLCGAGLGLREYLKEGHSSPVGSLVLVAMGLCMLAIPVVLGLERARTVRRIDVQGLERVDGRRYAWADFREVKPLTEYIQSRGSIEVGVEFRFTSGSAILKYRTLRNREEVAPVIAAMQNFDADRLIRMFSK